MLVAALGAADQARTPWRCAALDTPPLADEAVGGWKLAGRTMSRDADALTIGVVADAAGAAPRTIAALGRLRARFDEAAPDLVLALGGMGATRPSSKRHSVRSPIKRSGWSSRCPAI